ncbi:hypothetical protein EK21DRAFT_114868 [Setomelanomma holmii]|uniref:Uncharacterized protein n=1 Tax=Setomelanomma holmii TaxID=210430 RepID=A0A9P4H316_9PLEO|nr:hypothetical protein EK21DRAFT_114868 [Setomelanomma holmii]
METSGRLQAHEVVCNQPPEVYYEKSNRGFLMRLLPMRLERNTEATTSLPGPLPSVILPIIDSIMRTTYQTTKEERLVCIKRVCADIVHLSPKLQFYVFNHAGRRYANISNNTGEKALCVAIGSHDRNLVQQLVQAGVTIWGKTNLFGTTLEYALKRGTMEIIADMIAHSGMAANRKQRKVQQRMVDTRIYYALDRYNFDITDREARALENFSSGTTRIQLLRQARYPLSSVAAPFPLVR